MLIEQAPTVTLKCMYCLVAAQAGQLDTTEEPWETDRFLDRGIVPPGRLAFITPGLDANLVYKGESVCLAHWNVVRGWPRDYGAAALAAHLPKDDDDAEGG